MSVAPELPPGGHLTVVPGGTGSRGAFPPLPDEPAWWAAAPLRDGGRRELPDLPPGALEALTRHYLPFVLRGLDRYTRVLAVYLGDAEDVAGQAALWLLDAMRTYAARAPFAGYLASMFGRWVQDAARVGGRYVADSELGHARAVERSLTERHRLPTLAEEAAEFGEDPAATAERLRAVAVRRGLRRPADVGALDVDALPVAGDGALWVCLPGPDGIGADARLLALEEARVFTATLVASACDGAAGMNARGWWTLLLEHYDGFCRADLVRAGRTSRRTIVAAQDALLTAARERLADAS